MYPRRAYQDKALNDLFDAFYGKDKDPKDDGKKDGSSPKKPSGPVVASGDPLTGQWTDLGGFGGLFR